MTTINNAYILNSFISYYEYSVKHLDLTHIPESLFNTFHECNDYYDQFRATTITLYSGSKDYRNINLISDWTTDIHTAARFADDKGFIVSILKEGFVDRFNFISMDVLYDYLDKIITNIADRKILESYVSESEVYATELKDKAAGKSSGNAS